MAQTGSGQFKWLLNNSHMAAISSSQENRTKSRGWGHNEKEVEHDERSKCNQENDLSLPNYFYLNFRDLHGDKKQNNYFCHKYVSYWRNSSTSYTQVPSTLPQNFAQDFKDYLTRQLTHIFDN